MVPAPTTMNFKFLAKKAVLPPTKKQTTAVAVRRRVASGAAITRSPHPQAISMMKTIGRSDRATRPHRVMNTLIASSTAARERIKSCRFFSIFRDPSHPNFRQKMETRRVAGVHAHFVSERSRHELPVAAGGNAIAQLRRRLEFARDGVRWFVGSTLKGDQGLNEERTARRRTEQERRRGRIIQAWFKADVAASYHRVTRAKKKLLPAGGAWRG